MRWPRRPRRARRARRRRSRRTGPGRAPAPLPAAGALGSTLMELLQPDDLAEALELRAAHPGALPLWGGTDVMVDLNFGRERPEAIIDLTRVRELAEWGEREDEIRIGAGVSYTTAIADLGDQLPGLAAASRTVGSPQIRNRGTIGGNLGS